MKNMIKSRKGENIMDINCSFDVYLVGNKKDIESFNKIMQADYSYGLTKAFLRILGIYKEDDWVFTNEHAFITLEEARRKAKLEGNDKANEMLKDENLKREYFKNIPECGHFYKIFAYYPDEDMEKIDDNTFAARSWGTCSWSLEVCIVGSKGTGCYEENKEVYPEHIFGGTNLVEFVKKVPNLKIAMISEGSGCNFSEFYTFIDGKLVESECAEVKKVCYDSVRDAADDGIKITEDEIGKNLYVEFPQWFDGDREEIYVNEDYVFDKLGVDC